MKKNLVLPLAAVLALAGLTAPLAAQAASQAAAQAQPVDMKKLVTEIAGDYSFELQGQTLLVQFFAQDDKLFGAPPGETPEEIRPVEGKPLCFDVTVASNGDYYLLQFVRNDKGVIDKCVMTVRDMAIEGNKVIK